MKITIEGPAACGKSHLIHQHLIPAFRAMNRGARFFEEGKAEPTMVLSGPVPVDVFEKQTPNENGSPLERIGK